MCSKSDINRYGNDDDNAKLAEHMEQFYSTCNEHMV